jgi:sulfur carrier protein
MAMNDPQKIEIELNGEPYAIEVNSSIEQLLIAMGKGIESAENSSPRRFGAVAVELNAEIVSHDQFSQTQLNDGDKVEVVTLVGGG